MRRTFQNARFRYSPLTSRLLPCALLVALTGCGSGLRSVPAAGSPALALVVSAAPKLGYAWNAKDKSLRPIVGVPGAAQFGESVTQAGTYEGGEADPTGMTAILLGDAGSIYTLALPAGAPTLVAGKASAAAKVIFAPRGGWAFVYTPGSTEGKLLTQLSSTPQIKSVTFTAALKAAAVSDAGAVAAALTAPGGVTVQVNAASGAVVPLMGLKSLGGMSFIAGTDDLLLADAGTDNLFRVRAASTSPAVSPIATSGLLKVPVSMATSPSARWAVIANSGEASVVRVDLTGGTPAQRTVCNCQPSTVNQLTGEGTFRLTALQDGPVWIGDASKAAFPVLFIPALPGDGKGVTR